jgi:hypothetical protein
MPMPPYPVLCYRKGCGQPATYKIAACWSDGLTQELKTYALSCPACLAEWFRQSRLRQAACRTTRGETLEVPGIFELARGQRDRQLVTGSSFAARTSSSRWQPPNRLRMGWSPAFRRKTG